MFHVKHLATRAQKGLDARLRGHDDQKNEKEKGVDLPSPKRSLGFAQAGGRTVKLALGPRHARTRGSGLDAYYE